KRWRSWAVRPPRAYSSNRSSSTLHNVWNVSSSSSNRASSRAASASVACPSKYARITRSVNNNAPDKDAPKGQNVSLSLLVDARCYTLLHLRSEAVRADAKSCQRDAKLVCETLSDVGSLPGVVIAEQRRPISNCQQTQTAVEARAGPLEIVG